MRMRRRGIFCHQQGRKIFAGRHSRGGEKIECGGAILGNEGGGWATKTQEAVDIVHSAVMEDPTRKKFHLFKGSIFHERQIEKSAGEKKQWDVLHEKEPLRKGRGESGWTQHLIQLERQSGARYRQDESGEESGGEGRGMYRGGPRGGTRPNRIFIHFVDQL